MKNRLDLGCYLETTETAPGLNRHFSNSAPVRFVANRHHPLAGQSSVSLARIVQENFILTEEVGVYYQSLFKLLAHNHLSIREGIRLKSTRGIVEVLKYSSGISFLPEYAVRQEIRQGTLQVIPVAIPPVRITVTVTTHRENGSIASDAGDDPAAADGAVDVNTADKKGPFPSSIMMFRKKPLYFRNWHSCLITHPSYDTSPARRHPHPADPGSGSSS